MSKQTNRLKDRFKLLRRGPGLSVIVRQQWKPRLLVMEFALDVERHVLQQLRSSGRLYT